MIGKKLIKRIGAGLLSGLCAFSMLGSSMSGVVTANAAKIEFPSRDKVISQAAQLLGCKYTYGAKGGNPYSTPYTLKTVSQTMAQGIDCSGLVWWTLTNLGYKTSGFGQNNPVPADTFGWLGTTGTKTITYGGITENIVIEKANLPTPADKTAAKTYEYWECVDGSTITPGSVVVAQNPGGIDHAWIYMGEFSSRSAVVAYLKEIGVPASKITTATVGDGKGDGGTHWRIESNGSEGVVINNKTDGKKATALKMYGFKITSRTLEFSITKKNRAGNAVGKSSVDGSTAQYGVYTEYACKNKVATITIGANGIGRTTLEEGTYYVKEIKAPKGYELDPKVYTMSGGSITSIETETYGSIKINKTADDGVIKDHEFKVSYTFEGVSYNPTKKTSASGIAVFDNLPVYDQTTGKAVKYTVSEINVDTRYETPKVQNVYLTSGDKDFTVTTKFENNNKTGNIKINKQSDDGKNGDRTFKVTGNGKSYTAKTNASGIAEFKDLPVYDKDNKKIVYTISEQNVPIRYVVPANQTATLTVDATVTKTFKNNSKTGNIKINKQAEDGKIGARTFTISGNGKTWTMQTNENGIAELKGIPVYDSNDKKITYTISEKDVPIRYAAPADQTTTLTADLTVTKTFDNQLKKGHIKVNKQAEDNDVANRKFTVTGNGKTWTRYTSNTGIAEFRDLPVYDSNNNKITYKISEKDVPIKYAAPADQKTTLTVDATVTKTFVNKLANTSIQIFKEAEDDIIEGVKFKITGGGKTYNVVTDKDGYAELNDIKAYDENNNPITYTVMETDVPLRYIVPAEQTTTVTVNRASVVKFDNQPKTGDIKINKQAEDGENGGRTFKVTGNGKTYSAKTNKDGIAEFKDLPVYDVNDKPIEYTISEKNVPLRYVTPADQKTTLSVDATVTKTFKNDLKKGGIKINKQSDDGQNGGRTFTVSGNGQTYTAKTDKNGIAEFSELPVYDKDDKAIEYTISEKDVPIRYVVPADQKTTLIADATTEKTFKNESKKGSILINKQAEDGVIGDRTFEVSGNGKTYTAVTNKKGIAEFKELPVYDVNDNPITYTISEKNVPLKYVVPAAQTTTLTADETVKKTFDNNIKKGYISIIKHSDEDANVVENFEEGAEFQVYSKAYNSYDEAPEDERDYLITDRNGYDKTVELPYGTYIVHQTKTVNDAEYAADFEVEVTENEKTYEYVINNAPYQAFVKVTKIDAETGKAVALGGAGFEIYRADKTQVIMTIDGKEYSTFYTDSNGIVMTPATLGYGKYTLVEVQAPEGYVLDSTPVTFKVTRANSTIENAVNVVLLTKKDTPQKGTISVEKYGEVFIGFVKSPQENAPKDGFGIGKLSGAKFEVRAAEDIVTADGTKRLGKGDLAAVMISGEDGCATSEPLYLGKYIVTEVEAPFGYVLNSEPQTVELTYAGQNVTVNDGAKAEFFNHYQRVKIHLTKFMEKDELFGIGNNDEFKKVTFGLFSAEKMYCVDGKVLPPDYLISEIALEADQTATFDKMIPFGKYYVQELSTDEHYVINGEKYPVTYSYAGQEIKTVEIDCGTFENNIKRGSVKGIKVGKNDEPLENALFGLFKAKEKKFTEARALMTATSDSKGNFSFDGIAYGDYLVKEIKAPDGYKLSDKIYKVKISKNEQVIEIKAENDSIDVDVSKQDVYGNELPGARMQLVDKDGNVIDKWKSTKKNHTVTKLKAGDYTLKEIAAPTGYVIATDISFSVDEYGVVTVNGVEATASDDSGNPTIVMVDDTTKTSITKTDISGDKEVEGAEMKLFDSDGNIVEEWTSTDEAHEINGRLKAGDKYTLHEESAPDGYVIAADIVFTVSEKGEIDVVTMKDDTTKVEISKTAVIVEKKPEIKSFSEFNTDKDAQEVYDLLIKIGFTPEKIHQIYLDKLAGKVDQEYLENAIVGMPINLEDIGTLLEMKNDGRVHALSLAYKDFLKYVEEASKPAETVPEELIGAVLQIIDKDGKVIDEWTTTAERHYLDGILTAGETYTLHEVSAPDGYVVAADIEFTVSKDGSVDEINMVDDTTKVHITKTDITGDKEIPGASMKLFDEEGNLIDEWVSTEEAHEIVGKLTAGDKYTLHEESAPDGYVVAADIEFTVSETGEIDAITMKDDTTKVKISKKDITTDEELPGANLQIIDENGEIVEEWVSTTEPHYVEGKLIAGKEYILREITAPNGYELANDVRFTVDENGNVTEVVMYDTPTPETPPSKPPKTGAEANDSGVGFALAALAIGAILLIATRKKVK
ncbi:Cna protein B-type domain-containing protein [Ruminococcaceae bacterium FB2012]|nr:Cna protein B-type domain-containing protein [Ruminococcaceae bacterium FB2012]